MNHIVMGTDDQNHLGMILGFAGIAMFYSPGSGRIMCRGFTLVSCNTCRSSLHILYCIPRQPPSTQQHYTELDISPRFWPNGTMPVRDDWKQLAKGGFQEFRLKVGGLVDNPVELSLADIEKLGNAQAHHHASLHPGLDGDCQVGRSPHEGSCRTRSAAAERKVVAFFSFGGSLYGGLILRHAAHGERTQSGVSACFPDEWEATSRGIRRPIAAAVENQLGYKMVKWIERNEFIETEKTSRPGRRRQE